MSTLIFKNSFPLLPKLQFIFPILFVGESENNLLQVLQHEDDIYQKQMIDAFNFKYSSKTNFKIAGHSLL